MYVRTPSPEVMNHCSSLCFGLCLGWINLNRTGAVVNDLLSQPTHDRQWRSASTFKTYGRTDSQSEHYRSRMSRPDGSIIGFHLRIRLRTEGQEYKIEYYDPSGRDWGSTKWINCKKKKCEEEWRKPFFTSKQANFSDFNLDGPSNISCLRMKSKTASAKFCCPK